MPWYWFRQREPVARFTLYLGFFTLALALAGFLQWRSLASQLAEMKVTRIDAAKATRLEQRAWVGVQDAISVPGSFTDTSAWRVNVVFFNSGKTPAKAAEIAVLSFTSPSSVSGPSEQLIKALKFVPTQAIAPQEKFTFAVGTPNNWVSTMVANRADMESLILKYPLINKGELILYYFGILRYEDNSGVSRETQFCIYMAKPETQEISFCRDFNELN